MEIAPFAVAVPDETLADLSERLNRVRWPDEVEDAGWAYGADLAFMQELVRYWRTEFDWRAQERAINRFSHARVKVEGHWIHIVHQRGTGPRPIPLLLTHGWPSSFYEMLDLVPLLADPGAHGADPADAFDVVVPSVPGYGFSERPTHRGFDYRRIAGLWDRLMMGLGYERFGAHAYDIGASIMSHLLIDRPERLIGYHTTEPANPSPYLGPGAAPLSTAERSYLALQQEWGADEGGYMAIQTTRPQTLGYGLNDSPVGLAAWVIEKWRSWTVSQGGDLTHHFTMDQLLTNVTIYWVTETINSANRLYFERAHHPRQRLPNDRIAVPTGVALTTQAIERIPRQLASRIFVDIRQWIDLGRGGHFVALEEPHLLADAIRRFFRPLR
ncbi:MAG: epoxide hydrolase [Chloroflexota bacterium]|nr:epoxide hydrolase [Chloroflexota bacterium]